jgi:hypothetical protein
VTPVAGIKFGIFGFQGEAVINDEVDRSLIF